MAKAIAYVGEFSIALSMFQIEGRLVPIRAKKETALKSICPLCTENLTKPEQYYICPNHPDQKFKQGELHKAKEVNKTLVKVNVDEVKQAKESSLQLNYLELKVYPANEVAQATYPGDGAYIFYPKHHNALYSAFVDVVGDPQNVLMGTVNLKHYEKLVKLDRWHDFLIVQELLFPEDLNETVETPLTFTDEHLATMLEFVDKHVREFNAEDYRNEVKARVLALTASGENVAPVKVKSNTDADALKELQAFLESTKEKV